LPRRWKSNANGHGYSYDSTTGKSDANSHSHSKWDGYTASIGYTDSDGNHQTDANAKATAYAISTAHAVTAKELQNVKSQGLARQLASPLLFALAVIAIGAQMDRGRLLERCDRNLVSRPVE